MAPAMSCININQQHEATIKKIVVHYAVSERSCTIEREKAFPSTDGTLDGGSTGLINSGLCVHPGDVLEIRANRRTNCRKTIEISCGLRFQFMPSEVKRGTPLTCCGQPFPCWIREGLPGLGSCQAEQRGDDHAALYWRRRIGRPRVRG